MLDMFEEEDEKDLDWLPPKLEARRNKTQNNSKKGRYLPIEYQFTALITQPAPDRPKTYKKGPDVMSKSKRTQQRYQRTFRGQGKLTGFGFKAPSYPPRVETPKSKPKVTIRAAVKVPVASEEPIDEIAQPLNLPAPSPSRSLHARAASVLLDPSTDNDEAAPVALANVEEGDAGKSDWGDELSEVGSGGDKIKIKVEIVEDNFEDAEDDLEDAEDELEEGIQGPKSHIRDWTDLRKDIKDHLKKCSKTLPLSQINQLLIISNFATLRLKGLSCTQASLEIARQWHEGQGNWFSRRVRALARHFQIFEKLPVEKWGGSANARSWLHDE